MRQKILFMLPILLFFVAGHLSKNILSDEDKKISKVSQNISHQIDQRSTGKRKVRPPEKKAQVIEEKVRAPKQSLREMMVKGGQGFFHLVFDSTFWAHISDSDVRELVDGYNKLQVKSLEVNAHRGPQQNINRTKLGFLKSLAEYYLGDNLSADIREEMISFHKSILAKEGHTFIKRQAVVNLKRIIHFTSERERNRFIAALDKRALYLSELSTDEILNKVLNENH